MTPPNPTDLITPPQTESSHHGRHAPWWRVVAGVAAIASAYVFFLIFAEFSFIRHAAEVIPAGWMRGFMAILGIAGVAGSYFAAYMYRPTQVCRLLASGYALCGVAAALAYAAQAPVLMMIAGFATGLALGWTAVMLALALRPALHRVRLGLWCGLGTGLAYAICNIPEVFRSSARGQILVAIIAAGVGLVASFGLAGSRPSELTHMSGAQDYRKSPFIAVVFLFLVLVFLDSMVFYILQNSAPLRPLMWDETLVLVGNAFVHFCAAVLAGFAFDRHRFTEGMVVALCLLAGSSWLLGADTQALPAARILYVTGVSIYSTALVWFAARSAQRWKVAALFAISGWVGSALAIAVAMQQIRGDLARWLAPMVLVAGLLALVIRYAATEKAKS